MLVNRIRCDQLKRFKFFEEDSRHLYGFRYQFATDRFGLLYRRARDTHVAIKEESDIT